MSKIILGGGLSGLSAAFYLSKLLSNEQAVLLESSGRLGGWLRSDRVGKNLVFEQGPRTIRPGGAAGINTLNLLDELSIDLDIQPIIRTNPAAKNRLIYANGELHLLPTSLFALFSAQKPFSKSILRHILHDLTATPKHVEDESIYEFTKRRFGVEIADYLVDTIICGICAGSSKEISVKFLMKNLFAYEQKYGSVIKGVIGHMFEAKEQLPESGVLAARAKAEKWSVYSFRNGIETLPIELQATLRSRRTTDIQLQAKCQEINFGAPQQATVHLEDGRTLDSGHVISSIPAKYLAPMVQGQHPQLAEKLLKIKTVTVGVVNLMYKKNHIKHPAFGFLVPPKEKLPILGTIFDSCSQKQPDNTVLTVMMGGYWFKSLFGDTPSKDTLLKVATDQMKSILNIDEPPEFAQVNILKECIPQYIVGHQQNLHDIREYIRQNQLPLSLCGASYDGVGINDVILSARRAVEGLQ